MLLKGRLTLSEDGKQIELCVPIDRVCRVVDKPSIINGASHEKNQEAFRIFLETTLEGLGPVYHLPETHIIPDHFMMVAENRLKPYKAHQVSRDFWIEREEIATWS